jgi:hypothetical protein
VSELADLIADVSNNLSPAIRKILDAAVENGWELAKPGMTLCLRLDNPADELALPVYACWVVGRSPSGKMSFRFSSSATSGLNPLSGADLVEYLKDPTVVYPDPPEKTEVPWDETLSPAGNLVKVLDAKPVPAPLRVAAPKVKAA